MGDVPFYRHNYVLHDLVDQHFYGPQYRSPRP